MVDLSKRHKGLSREEVLKVIPEKSFEQFYKIGPELGEGSFGVVYEATRLSDQRILAVKIFIKPPTQDDVNECLLMSQVKNDFSLSAIDYFINTDMPYF